MTDTEQIASPPTGGYRTPPRYRVVHGAEGSQYEGLWAEIRSNLLGGEIDALNADQTWRSLERLMAPFVVAWNVVAPVMELDAIPAEIGPDGKTEVMPERHETRLRDELLPPPAEAGPDVFRRVDKNVKWWLKTQLSIAPMVQGEETLKPSTRSGLTPDGPPAAIEPSPSAASSPKTSRRSERAATAS
jgi:hypothetical protein